MTEDMLTPVERKPDGLERKIQPLTVLIAIYGVLVTIRMVAKVILEIG